MKRFSAAALASLAWACAGSNEPPVGVSTAPYDETGRSEPAPTGGGGYDFGASGEQARATCSARRGVWKSHPDGGACVERHDAAGASKLSIVEFCERKLCRVHTLAVFDDPSAKVWLTAFEHLRRELVRRHGAPDEQAIELPAECEQALAECVKNGSASAALAWRWPDGHSILLRLGRAGEVPAAISVSYVAAGAGPSDDAAH